MTRSANTVGMLLADVLEEPQLWPARGMTRAIRQLTGHVSVRAMSAARNGTARASQLAEVKHIARFMIIMLFSLCSLQASQFPYTSFAVTGSAAAQTLGTLSR